MLLHRRFYQVVAVTLPIRLRNDVYCVEWGVKLYSLTHADFGLLRIGLSSNPHTAVRGRPLTILYSRYETKVHHLLLMSSNT